ncbi:DUF6221 family protein [Streptomyces sp. NPDC055078]
MTDLVTFLRARLDEDETGARAAMWDEQSDTWTACPPQAAYDRYVVVDYCDDGVVAVTPENADTDGVGQHIARHDPARTLREVDAKRRILRLHNIPAVVSPKMAALGLREGEAPEDDRRCVGCGLDMMDEPITADINECPILRALALPYADHPEWRP